MSRLDLIRARGAAIPRAMPTKLGLPTVLNLLLDLKREVQALNAKIK